MASFRRALLTSTSRPIRPQPFFYTSTRQFSRSPSLAASKEDQDKDSINILTDEYSKSGGDHIVAQQGKASYDQSETDPESQMARAGKGNTINPLEISPANPEVSKHVSENDGPEKGVDKTATSKKSSPMKHQTVNVYEKRTDHQVWEKVQGGRNS